MWRRLIFQKTLPQSPSHFNSVLTNSRRKKRIISRSSGVRKEVNRTARARNPDETEESAALKNSAVAIELFGASVPSQHRMELSSPVLGAQNDHPMGRHDEVMRLDLSGKEHHSILAETPFGWDSLQSPEDVELSELDDMLDAY